LADDANDERPDADKGALRTFLIADVRGYTRYSDEHGDEAASALASRFAAIVRSVIPTRGGEVVELRGDEALCVFASARAALWSAVELQRSFREVIDGAPALPLGVGIGLDAGEAVPTEGGYRGRALNVAARLCSLAKPGEILASETVTNLAGRQGRATFAPRRPTRVKGVGEPIRHVEVVPEDRRRRTAQKRTRRSGRFRRARRRRTSPHRLTRSGPRTTPREPSPGSTRSRTSS
jgi:class 3 adenylate cyclase